MSYLGSEKEDSVPVILPGFRFFPSEEVLVSFYLKNKNQGNDSKFRDIIPEIEVCKHEPFDLPAFFDEPDVPDHDREWFFFSRPDRKYINSTRCNRATDQGFYKITGKEREIKARRSKAVVGYKRTLTFYLGRMPKATKTDWVMHEYSLVSLTKGPNPNQQTDFVLCRLKNKSICNELAKPGTGGYLSSNSENQAAAPASNDMITDTEEFLTYKALENAVLGSDNHDAGQAGGSSPSELDDRAVGDMIQGLQKCLEPVENLKDDSICDELAEPATGSYIASKLKHDLHGSDNLDENTESPNGSCLIDNSDISTFDGNEPSEWNLCFGNQTLAEVLEKLFDRPGEDRDSPSPPPQPPQPHLPPQPPHSQQDQPPQPTDCCSSKLQSPSCTKLVKVPRVYNDDCSMRQSTIEDNDFYLKDKNNISTNDHNGPVSEVAHDPHSRATDERNFEVCNNSTNIHNEQASSPAYNVQNRATCERISEDYIQLEDLRSSDGPFWLQDHALQSPMNTELGDVEHANKVYWMH